MKTVIISKSNEMEDEHHIITQMFDAGLEYFHIRKPYFVKDEMIRYLDGFNTKHLKHLIVHTHHRTVLKYPIKGIHISRKHRKRPEKTWVNVRIAQMIKPKLHLSVSSHDLADLKKGLMKYSYIFLSPIFDSISKYKYKAAFKKEELVNALGNSKKQVIALGGVDEDKIEIVREMGFAGVALMGAIWNSKDPVEKFIKIQSLCQKNDRTH